MQVAVGKRDITVVIPTLNEGKTIGQVVGELSRESYDNVLVSARAMAC